MPTSTPTSTPTSAPSSTPTSRSAVSLLRQAARAFAAGRFAEASGLAVRIPDGAPVGAQARYLQGYALYKLGRTAEAAKPLERSMALKPSAQVAFMCGLVAFERHRAVAARRWLAPLVAAKKEPWSKPAAELLRRLREQQAVARQARHVAAIRRAKTHLEASRFLAAAQALGQAEQILPGHKLNFYYRGYLAYQRGNLGRAQKQLRRVLAVDPGDRWTRYMLALSLEVGAPERKRLLVKLSEDNADPALRQAAREALRVRRRPTFNGFSLQLEVGTGLDTSPSSAGLGVTELPRRPPPPGAPPLEPQPQTATVAEVGPAWALRGKVELSYRRQLAPRHVLRVGLRLVEQAYGVGGENYGQTELAGALYYGWRGERFDLAVTYGYGLYLLAHAPLMSLHDVAVHGGMLLRPGLRLAVGGLLRVRDMHDASYDFLQALEPSAYLALGARWSALSVTLGYHVLRSQADPAELQLSERLNQQNELVTTNYLTDYSYWGHGPRLALELTLPWRLSLGASAWLLWGLFDQPDRFIERFADDSKSVVIWQGERRDLLILASVELRRSLGHGLSVALSFSSTDNLSTLDGAGSTPVDRAYHRRLLLGVVRWRWPAR